MTPSVQYPLYSLLQRFYSTLDYTMSEPLELPTWVFLSSGDLPPATLTPRLLGAIVPDFEHPAVDFVPDDASMFRSDSSDVLTMPSKDFDSALGGDTSGALTLHFAELLRSKHSVELSNTRALKSKYICTWTLSQPRKIFDAVKARHEQEILRLIERNPKRHRGAVYMVVGIKVCLDPEMSTESSTARDIDVNIGVPVNSIVTAATGVILPVDASIGAEVQHHNTQNSRVNQIVCGAYIFAVQYRMIMKESGWKVWTARKPRQTQYGDWKTVPKAKGFYTGEEDSGSDDEEDCDEAEEDPERLRLGKLQCSESLSPEGEKVLVDHME
jgi:hypothetical protein